MNDILDNTFRESDFENMMYPIYKVDHTMNLIAMLPALKKINTFVDFRQTEVLKRDKVIRYVIYTYDRQSPIFIKYDKDERKRKMISAVHAGFTADHNGLFEDEVDDMMKCLNSSVNKMIIEYVRQYNDPEYSLLVAGQDAYYQKLQLLLQPDQDDDDDEEFEIPIGAIDGQEPGEDIITNPVPEKKPSRKRNKRDEFQIEETKGKLFNQAKLMAKDLGELATKILTDDNKYLKRDFFCIIDEKAKNRLSITPERMFGVS